MRDRASNPSPTDVAIVGGGVVGVACAFELARRGVSVRVVERGRVGHGCSYGNAGWLTPSLAFPLAAPGQTFKAIGWLFDRDSPFYIQPRLDAGLAMWLLRFLATSRKAPFERGARALIELSRRSVDFWEELARDHEFGFSRHGLLCVYESERALAEGLRRAEFVGRFGVAHEAWSSDDVGEREPLIFGARAGGVFYPNDAHCDPYGAVCALRDAAIGLGVRFEEHTEVLDVVRNGAGSILKTSGGELRANEVVLAAGAWSGSLARRIGLKLPMLGAKGYSFVAPFGERSTNRSIYLVERKVALSPYRDGLRIAGTLELVDDDLSVDQRRVGGMIDGVRRMLSLPLEPLQRPDVWRGLRPCTPDGMPAIGRARSSLWLATGHQMTGLKTAPATGRLLAELICGDTPSVDPLPFRADRF